MATCSSCRLETGTPYRYCRSCKAAWMRANRPRHGELTKEQRRRANCRSYTHILIKRGHLLRKPCSHCGSEPAEAHHPDYSNPRLLKWLCRPHHRSHHAETP